MPAPNVPLAETLAFLQDWLPERARVLDVGCGEGELASLLLAAGHDVFGLEPDPERLARARERGVDAHAAGLADFHAPPFDALVFSRTLHHVHPLAAGLDQARTLLAPGGVAVVEDFAFREVDADDVAWFHRALQRYAERTSFDPEAHGFAARVWRAEGSPSVLEEDLDHPHELATAEEMQRQLAARFTLRHTATPPYYFRYLSQVLPAGAASDDLVRELLAEERAAIAAGDVKPLGRRYVASAG